MSKDDYLDEDIRQFFIKRTFLVGDGGYLTEREYERLKERSALMTGDRADYLRAFMDGWTAAKG